MMDFFGFSIGALIAGFIFSIVGLWLFKDWRRSGNPWHFGTGLALMIFPYFVATTLPMIACGAALLGLAYVKR